MVGAFLAGTIACFAYGEGFISGFFDVFAGGVGNYVAGYIFIWITGLGLGTLMNISGISQSLAEHLIKWFGEKSVLWIIVLFGVLVSLAGIPAPTFVIWALAMPLLKKGNIPAYIGMAATMGATCLGQFVITGVPGMPNLMPTMYMGTTLYSAPFMSLICCVVGFGCLGIYLMFLVKRARKVGDGFVDVANNELVDAAPLLNKNELPSFFVSIMPIIIVCVGTYVFSNILSLGTTASVVFAQAIGMLWCMLLRWSSFKEKGHVNTLVEIAQRALPMVIAVGCIFGFGNIASSLTCYDVAIQAIARANLSPYITCVLMVALIAAVTSDGISGIAIFCSTFAADLMAAGADPAMLHRLTTMTATTFDSLPHSNSVQQALIVYGYNTKTGYKYLFMVTVVITTLCTLVGLIYALVLG